MGVTPAGDQNRNRELKARRDVLGAKECLKTKESGKLAPVRKPLSF